MRSSFLILGRQTLDHCHVRVDDDLFAGVSAIVASSLFGIHPKPLSRQGGFGYLFHLV